MLHSNQRVPFVLLALLCCLPVCRAEDAARGVRAAQPAPGPAAGLYKHSAALVIGNGDYRAGWEPLRHAVNDSIEVATALYKRGFAVVLHTNLTHEAFDRVFAEFIEKHASVSNAQILVYYAGHGHTTVMANEEELGYLVMVDAPRPDADNARFHTSSVDMESLVTQAKRMRAKHVLFMFDCCFSGTILNVRKTIVPEHISDKTSFPVRQFITAGRANEPVPDRSFFKQCFLDLLDGRDKELVADGYITGEELGLYLQTKVPAYSKTQHPQYGKIADPRLDKGDFVFLHTGQKPGGVTVTAPLPPPPAAEPPWTQPPPAATGAILLETSRSGKAIIDGKRQIDVRSGDPTLISDLGAGKHEVYITAGRLTWREQVAVTANETKNLRVELESATRRPESWYISPRVGCSFSMTGFAGVEVQIGHLGVNAGWSFGPTVGIRYYWEPIGDSWMIGVGGYRFSPETDYEDASEEGIGLLLGYVWRWPSGWELSLGSGIILGKYSIDDRSYSYGGRTYVVEGDEDQYVLPNIELAVGYSF